MALRVFEEEFGKARIKRGMTKRLAYDAAVRDQFTGIFNAVQGVVDVMRDPKTGDHYRVVMSAEAGAATSPGQKVIKISWRPVFDKSLRVSTACTVMTGLVFHEVGHTLDTFPFLDAFRKVYGDERMTGRGTWDPDKMRWAKPYDALAFTVLNIVEDKRLEVRQERRYPVCRDVFPTMLHWVALTTGMVGQRVGWNEQRTRPAMLDRVNFVTFATRYPWTAQWEATATTRAERKWWQDWSNAYALLEDEQVEERLAAIAVGLTALRSPEREVNDDDDQPDDLPPVDDDGDDEEPPITCGPTGPGGDKPGNSPADDFDEDDDEDEDGDDTDGGQPGGDDGEDGEDEDGEGDGDSESDEDDEDGDDFGTNTSPDLTDEEDESDGDDEDGDEPGGDDGDGPDVPPAGWDDEPSDEDGEDEGDGGSGDGEDGDEPTDKPGDEAGDGDEASDEDGDDTDGDGDGDGGDDAAESKPEPITDDYDGRETTGVDATNKGDNDDYSQKNRAKWMDDLITAERSIDRIDSGKYGKARIAPRNIADIVRQ